jgi:hypothetical protein
VFPQHPDAVRIVHHDPRAEFFAGRDNFRERRDVALHTIDAIHNHQDPLVGGTRLQMFAQGVHVAVSKTANFSESQPYALHDARMNQPVDDHAVAATNKRGNDPLIRLEAR